MTSAPSAALVGSRHILNLWDQQLYVINSTGNERKGLHMALLHKTKKGLPEVLQTLTENFHGS